MKTLKQSTLLIAALLFVSFAQAQWGSKKIKGNGNTTKITRNTPDYDVVKCAGSMDFIFEKGTEGNLTLEGDSNLLDYIITEVKNGTLVIKTKKGYTLKTGWNKQIKITIPFQDIEKISLAGSGDVITKDTIDSKKFEVRLAGSGDITLDVNATDVSAGVSGSGDITLKGHTTNLSATVTGSGDFHGFYLQAKNTEAKVTGSGGAEVVSTKRLKARVTGSGDIDYKGNPETKDTKVTGSGDIDG
ncbi:head GIN domain-containing protein [Pontimicrobium sp. MEBiC01747]